MNFTSIGFHGWNLSVFRCEELINDLLRRMNWPRRDPARPIELSEKSRVGPVDPCVFWWMVSMVSVRWFDMLVAVFFLAVVVSWYISQTWRKELDDGFWWVSSWRPCWSPSKVLFNLKLALFQFVSGKGLCGFSLEAFNLLHLCRHLEPVTWQKSVLLYPTRGHLDLGPYFSTTRNNSDYWPEAHSTTLNLRCY